MNLLFGTLIFVIAFSFYSFTLSLVLYLPQKDKKTLKPKIKGNGGFILWMAFLPICTVGFYEGFIIGCDLSLGMVLLGTIGFGLAYFIAAWLMRLLYVLVLESQDE